MIFISQRKLLTIRHKFNITTKDASYEASFSFQESSSISAVSYTHLDVYKRQASGALKYAMTYFNIKKKKDIPKGMIKAAWSSVARIAVAQIQDFLESDPTSRMNTPSTLGGNWQFRTKEEDFSEKLSKKILKLNKIYNR